MIQYKTNMLQLLKENGYSTYKLRKEKIFGEYAITQLRNGEVSSFAVINTICKLTGKQVGDLLTYVEE